MRGCNSKDRMLDCQKWENEPPTLERWPIDWLPVGQLLHRVPFTDCQEALDKVAQGEQKLSLGY